MPPGAAWFSLRGAREVATPGALAALERTKQPASRFLARHASGDWGALDPEDVAEKEYSMVHGFRLMSSYRTDAGETLWIITEAGRSATTLLLPDEYSQAVESWLTSSYCRPTACSRAKTAKKTTMDVSFWDTQSSPVFHCLARMASSTMDDSLPHTVVGPHRACLALSAPAVGSWRRTSNSPA